MKKSFVSPIVEKLAKKAGVIVNLEPRYRYVGQIVTASGKKRYFRDTNFDLNTLGAAEVAKDKDYTGYFLARMGYPVPEGETFFSPRWCQVIGSKRNAEAAYRYARRIGFPVVVKPNSKSQGFGVAKVHNKKEFLRAARFICQRENVFLVQRVVTGRDYRIVVLDNRVISAYERKPLAVTGDGKSSIVKLLRAKQEAFRRIGRDTTIDTDDFRIKTRLGRMGISMRSILGLGQEVTLLDNANLSSGGEAKDVTHTMHPAWKRLAAKITRDMGLRLCGVDVMVGGSITTSPTRYTVLEINAAPGLDHYAAVGDRQRRIVERLYLKVLLAMKKG